MAHLECPTCLHLLILDPQPEIGQPVICQNCGDRYQVIWLFPPELGPIEDPVPGEPPAPPHKPSPNK